MNRDTWFFLPDDAPGTFERDEKLDKLPLPKLEDTLDRYYRNLLPFGTADELKNSRKIIDNFKNGIGRELHRALEVKASQERNWVEKYWEDIGYHSLKFPLIPYMNMAQPFILDAAGTPESPEYRLKAAARISYYSAVFWDLIRRERLRPPTNPDQSVIFSSDLYKRLYNTTRVPGVEKDEVHGYFKTAREGQCPSTSLIVGKGRVFQYDAAPDGRLLTQQEHLHLFRLVDAMLENDNVERGVPILTADDRTSWAQNRLHLIELSPDNAEKLKIIESAAMSICFDENEPRDYSELAQLCLGGDFHCKWNDKASGMTVFKNGKIGFFGEHSAYDGTISIAFSTFILLSLLEESEPDWDEVPERRILPYEIKFKIDDHLRSEIKRMEEYAETVKFAVTAQCQEFKGFGKAFMKKQKIHPDAFVQTALQWNYYKMHGKLAPTYETATMRIYYHGRTETVRSCSVEVKEWIDRMVDGNATVSFGTFNKFIII